MAESFVPEDLLPHVGWLREFARALVRGDADAEDVTQATLATALARPPAEIASLPAWLRTVARNEARRVGRSEAARRARERRVSTPEASASGVEEVVAEAEMHRALVQHVFALDEPFRSTLILRDFEGRSTRAIARATGVAEATVRTRVKRGLDRIRRDLDGEANGDRSLWTMALLPLTRASGGGSPAWLGKGGGVMAMTTKAKSITIAAVLLLLAGVAL